MQVAKCFVHLLGWTLKVFVLNSFLNHVSFVACLVLE